MSVNIIGFRHTGDQQHSLQPRAYVPPHRRPGFSSSSQTKVRNLLPGEHHSLQSFYEWREGEWSRLPNIFRPSDHAYILCTWCTATWLKPEDFIITQVEGEHYGTRFGEDRVLGRLHEVLARSEYCKLCKLVLVSLGLLARPRHSLAQDELETWVSWNWDADGYLAPKSGPGVRMMHPQSPIVWSKSMSRLALCETDVPSDRSSAFLARLPSIRLRSRQLKKWLKACSRRHGEVCFQNYRQDQRASQLIPKSFRVIDTWSLCLAALPERASYLTLSYVWGRDTVLKLKKDTLAEFSTPNAFARKWDEIPLTIQDCIRLASMMRQRYLWVDSLCIIQDSADDKAELIQAMGSIYSWSYLTIVAVNCTGANSGLPGVSLPRNELESRVAQLRPGLRLVSPDDAEDALQSSVYESRAWTYQESRLSRRNLYVTPTEVTYSCKMSTWCESINFDGDGPGLSGIRRPTQALEDGRFSISRKYTDALVDFCARELTNQYDVTDAFEGMLQRLITLMAPPNPAVEGHLCGLPVSYFDWALTWTFQGTGKRRHNDLPSWSWCGWQGKYDMILGRDDWADVQKWTETKTWIRWIVMGRTKDNVQHSFWLGAHGWERSLEFPECLYPCASHNEAIPPYNAVVHRMRPEHCMLRFCTLSIDLDLRKTIGKTGRVTMDLYDGDSIMFGQTLPENYTLTENRSRATFALVSDLRYNSQQGINPKLGRTHGSGYHAWMLERVPNSSYWQRIGIGWLDRSVEALPRAIWKEFILT